MSQEASPNNDDVQHSNNNSACSDAQHQCQQYITQHDVIIERAQDFCDLGTQLDQESSALFGNSPIILSPQGIYSNNFTAKEKSCTQDSRDTGISSADLLNVSSEETNASDSAATTSETRASDNPEPAPAVNENIICDEEQL